ncbi:MAG: signal recognition particle receptor subunit alpha, partial [Campylobacteraceae bacterium]
MFDVLTESFKSAINKIRFSDDEKALKNALETLKKSLLKADVHHKVVKELLVQVEIDTKKAGVGQTQFLKAIRENLTNVLTVAGNQGFVFTSKPPTVVLMIGLQGSGKTTTTINLSTYLKQIKKKYLVASCDLQILAAVEQLKQLCSQNEIDLYIDDSEKNPVNIAKAALKKAKDELYDVLLVDTAGRFAIDEVL